MPSGFTAGAQVDFGTPYRLYMREYAPLLYASLERAGDLDRTISQAALAASADLSAMIDEGQLEGDAAGIQSAREIVLFRLLSTLDPYLPTDQRPDPDGPRQWEAMLDGQRVVRVSGQNDSEVTLLPPVHIPARSSRKRGFGFTAGALAGAALITGAWIAPGWTADAMAALYGPITTAAELAIAISLFILTPAAFVPALKPIAGPGLRYACWALGAALWATAWTTTYLHFGRGAATIGLGLLGAPILPMGLIAAAIARDWWTVLSLVVLFGGWLATWITSATMSHQAELREVRATLAGRAA